MSYSLGTKPIEPTPEMARWHKMTPDLVSAWRAAYPSDRGIAEVLRRTVYGPVYVGIADDNLYYISGRNAAGNIGGQYAVLQGQPQMTYEQVLRVFEPTASGPDTKFKPFSIADERPVAAPDRTGLYVALGIAGAALLAGGVYLATRKKAPAALTANRRRTKRLAANPVGAMFGTVMVANVWMRTRQELEAAVAAYKNLEGENLRSADLCGANLARAFLAHANLRGAALASANLEGATLEGADLSRANLLFTNLIRADLRDAILVDANLADADLLEANLSRANLTGAYLERAMLIGANLNDATLRGADLTGANLFNAYLERANLAGADLTDVNLRDANLADANLSSANLADATLRGADLTGADLRDVYYDSSTTWPDDFTPPPSRTALTANRRRTKRLAANSSFGPERDRVAARARAAFARGDTASARRALAELSSIDLALMPKALRRNDRRRAKRRTSALVKSRNGRARQ